MRVIAGEARRLPLVSPTGRGTRPTTDRIKETLFNMIQDEVRESEFLDLFSGSGAIGIEAISRGAKRATFIEMGREAVSCIKKNLEKTRLVSRSALLPMEVLSGIRKLCRQGVEFDIVYMDPPYDKGWEPKVLEVLLESGLLQEGSLVILETSTSSPLDYINQEAYELERIKSYKSNCHVFLRHKGEKWKK